MLYWSRRCIFQGSSFSVSNSEVLFFLHLAPCRALLLGSVLALSFWMAFSEAIYVGFQGAYKRLMYDRMISSPEMFGGKKKFTSDEIAIHVERQAGELVNELSRVPAACFIIMRSRSTWIRRCCTQCHIFLRATRRQGRAWCGCLSCSEVKVTLMPCASAFGLRRGVTSTYHWWVRGAVRPRWARNRRELRTTSQRVCLEIPVWHKRHQCDTIESAACPDCNSKWRTGDPWGDLKLKMKRGPCSKIFQKMPEESSWYVTLTEGARFDVLCGDNLGWSWWRLY